MNLYTVRKATQGLADYLNATDLPKRSPLRMTAAITANCSPAKLPACWRQTALPPACTRGWSPRPHFPGRCAIWAAGQASALQPATTRPNYNGYKVYGADGCQITLEVADKILAAIEKVDCFDGVKLVDYEAGVQAGRIVSIDDKCLDDFVQAVYDQRVGDGTGIEQLKLVYTPLNGTGLECVKTAGQAGGDPCDGGAGAGNTGWEFPHLPVSQPGNPRSHAEGTGTVR